MNGTVKYFLGYSCASVLLCGCSSNINNLPASAADAPAGVNLILAHQIVGKESVHPAFSLLSTAVSVAAGPASLVVDLIGQNVLVRIGEETDITMLDKLNLETNRQVSCAFLERGYEVSFSGFQRWEGDRFAGLVTNADFYAHMDSTYGYSRDRLFAGGRDTVVLAEYYVQLQEESVGDYLSELRFDRGSMRVTAATKNAADDEELLYKNIQYAETDYSRDTALLFFRKVVSVEKWPEREQVYVPECGYRSRFHARVESELTQDSTIADMRAFMTSLNIDYTLDRDRRFLHGAYAPEGDLDTVDERIYVRLHYDRESETFSRAASYFWDRRPQQ